MLTKIITAALALIVALMVLRYLSERAHRAQLHERVKSRRRAEAPPDPPHDPGPHVRPDVPLDGQPEPKPEAKPAKPGAVTTLEIDPDTGVYRPKG
jgi:hypothetical protein